ncbi:MAG: hypothetical protein QM741_13530 [Rudaea sp.]|uniref:hypothetical protein n=1 Tax=Rudaea sp. TaxID=2136325 RepID=UPI0039E41292
MMTKISMAEDTDAWCRRLGNFAPIAYRPESLLDATSRVHREPALRFPALAPRRGAAAQILLVAMVATGALPLSVAAQMPGGGMGGGMGGPGGAGGHGDHPPRDGQQGHGQATERAPDPLRAMLGEARKLRTELLLTADQIGPWSAMEDALREYVELARPPAPEARLAAPVDPQTFVQDLADHQRELADAGARFAARTKAVFAALNPRQLRTSKQRFADAIAGERQGSADASLP